MRGGDRPSYPGRIGEDPEKGEQERGGKGGEISSKTYDALLELWRGKGLR